MMLIRKSKAPVQYSIVGSVRLRNGIPSEDHLGHALLEKCVKNIL